MEKTGNYFFQAFIAIVLSVVAFLVFKLVLPERLFAEVTVQNDNIVVDSLLLEALADTTALWLTEDTLEYVYPDESIVDYFVNRIIDHVELNYFFEKLYQLEQKKEGTIRIAYFGDSMTEGDLIVQDFRKNYQSKYGGTGAGFIPLGLPIVSASNTVRMEFSKDWIIDTYLKKSVIPVGVNGYVFFAPDSSNVWTKYRKGSAPLVEPVLFYGKSDNDSALVLLSSDLDSVKAIQLEPKKLLNALPLTSTVNNLEIHFFQADSIPLYGIDFAGEEGVYVDNFSSRGNSGLPLSTFNVALMNEFQKKLDYDLIVLHYGTNVLSSKSFDYSWYAIRMGNTVKHLKQCFPNASILVVSIGDKATKYGTEMRTDSALIPLIKAQQSYAKKTESGFINLFELMGGEGTIIEWADENPPLAAKDYTHLSAKGGKIIADLLFKKLEEEYEIFKLEKALREEEERKHVDEDIMEEIEETEWTEEEEILWEVE